MNRILLDQGFSPRAAEALRAIGWDAIHVIEVGLASVEDVVILDFAKRESRTCITLDHDFHSHLALARADSPSVIFVRLEGLRTNDQIDLICNVYRTCADAIEHGAAITVDSSSVRIRSLPLR